MSWLVGILIYLLVVLVGIFAAGATNWFGDLKDNPYEHSRIERENRDTVEFCVLFIFCWPLTLPLFIVFCACSLVCEKVFQVGQKLYRKNQTEVSQPPVSPKSPTK